MHGDEYARSHCDFGDSGWKAHRGAPPPRAIRHGRDPLLPFATDATRIVRSDSALNGRATSQHERPARHPSNDHERHPHGVITPIEASRRRLELARPGDNGARVVARIRATEAVQRPNAQQGCWTSFEDRAKRPREKTSLREGLQAPSATVQLTGPTHQAPQSAEAATVQMI